MAELYSNTVMAETLTEVLEELVTAGQITDQLAVATLEQLTQSTYLALKEQVNAKAEIKGALRTYKYFDNVWQFVLKDISFRVNPTGQGSAKKAPEVICDKCKIVCVDIKLAP